MEHALYSLKKIKITLEYHQPIDSKLCLLMISYPKFYAINEFAQCIRDYSSAVNYNTTHCKIAHKYLLKAFYNITNKKKYNAQIRQNNIYYINIITIKDVIILEKA